MSEEGRKTCNRCHRTLPRSEFHKHETNRDGRQGNCKDCHREKSMAWRLSNPEKARRHNEKWLSKHPGYMERYMENYRRVTLGQIPLSESRSQVRDRNARKRIEKRRAAADRYRIKYGSEFAELFLLKAHYPAEIGKVHAFKLKQELVAMLTGRQPSNVLIARIEDLNRAAGKPLLSIGWSCEGCGLDHTNPNFFELDHVMPRHKGGRDHFANRQILCPNCHKKKTLGIDGFAADHDFRFRLRSEKTGELDPTAPTVAPPIERKDSRNDVPNRSPGHSLISNRTTQPFSGDSGAMPQDPLITDGSGAMPRPLQTSAIA